ncbi:MAG TPA: DUF2252 domain-containing protein [Myxococcota bacterium]|nr:DUF2252 domain-containing protein [Myxococcota bacterium]
MAAGKALREELPRHVQGLWKRDKDKVDPLAILRTSNKGRIDELIPIRHARMLQSPFTYYRGAAAVMAADLAKTATTGLRVQACGDCHLLNFGGFATPERNIEFGINDFDETLPAPWEWDIKRLVASFVLAARSQGLKESDGQEAAVACARSYRTRMREYSEMSPLAIWYAGIDLQDLIGLATRRFAKEVRARLEKRQAKATAVRGSELVYPQLAEMVSGQVRIQDAPPLIFHPPEMSTDELHARGEEALKYYRETLPDERRDLLDHYRLVDVAIKVVGIGSVGTYCIVLLMMSANNEPLFLQAKQARQSVLEPYAGRSAYAHAGQRVVLGQKRMQSSPDIFLGWLTTPRGVQAYVRQLRDAKIKPLVETMDATSLTFFARACGWGLARAHAKSSGSAAAISGYLGKTDNFDEAMGSFAAVYADQTERDHAALKKAVRSGQFEAALENF